MNVIKGMLLIAYAGALWTVSMTAATAAFFALLYICGTAIALVFGALP